MTEPHTTSIVSELVEGIERNRNRIKTIGYISVTLGVAFAVVLVAGLSLLFTSLYLHYRPMRFLPALPVLVILGSALAILSAVNGIKILSFISSWEKRYSKLEQAKVDLIRTYLSDQEQK